MVTPFTLKAYPSIFSNKVHASAVYSSLGPSITQISNKNETSPELDPGEGPTIQFITNTRFLFHPYKLVGNTMLGKKDVSH